MQSLFASSRSLWFLQVASIFFFPSWMFIDILVSIKYRHWLLPIIRQRALWLRNISRFGASGCEEMEGQKHLDCIELVLKLSRLRLRHCALVCIPALLHLVHMIQSHYSEVPELWQITVVCVMESHLSGKLLSTAHLVSHLCETAG